MKHIETANVIARKWFDKVNGNTYHSVTVYVNGEKLHQGLTYGYGSQYIETARTLLEANGYEVGTYGEFNRNENITFRHYDVKRKKDLATPENE